MRHVVCSQIDPFINWSIVLFFFCSLALRQDQHQVIATDQERPQRWCAESQRGEFNAHAHTHTHTHTRTRTYTIADASTQTHLYILAHASIYTHWHFVSLWYTYTRVSIQRPLDASSPLSHNALLLLMSCWWCLLMMLMTQCCWWWVVLITVFKLAD